MGWCKLGADEGAQALADLLMFNTTLASIDLRGNGLGDAGAWRPPETGGAGAGPSFSEGKVLGSLMKARRSPTCLK